MITRMEPGGTFGVGAFVIGARSPSRHLIGPSGGNLQPRFRVWCVESGALEFSDG